MCGIVGVASFDENFHKKINESIHKIEHRGPDNISCERITNCLSFAHARLSVVDINSRSNQPMTDHKTGNKLIFNGEIYNYKNLKTLLPERIFHTDSDTEILMYLFDKFGVGEALKLCNGPFAFAFWSNNKLYIGRDRFGKKPLFYYFKNNTLLFGSENKALFAFDIEIKPNHSAIINYIFESTIGFNRLSFFEDIFQIENSCYYIFEINEYAKKINFLKKEKYWNYPKTNKKISYKDSVNQLKDLLIDSVNIRLSEEVGFAVMLSGGLDSSGVASIAAKYNPDKIITSVSAVYPGSAMDESDYAKTVTEKYKNINPIWINNINFKKFDSYTEKVTYHHEIPLPDGSMVAQFILMEELHKRNIKVILSGIGGDEVFAGYPNIYFPSLIASYYKKLKFTTINLRAIYHLLPNFIKNAIYKIKHKKTGILKTNEILTHLNIRFQKKYKHTDLVNEYLIHSLDQWTIPTFVWYEDRSSMGNSIENRAPLLDFRIVEFMLSLNGNFKLDKNFTKKIYRDALIDILPEKIIKRKDKQGFHSPIKNWKDKISDEFLKDEKFKTEFYYLNFEKIAKSNFNIYWRTYSLYNWYCVFFKK